MCAGKTHRELFSEFYEDLLHEPLETALAVQPQPPAAVLLFQQMMRDVTTAGGVGLDPIGQVLMPALSCSCLLCHAHACLVMLVPALSCSCLLYHDHGGVAATLVFTW